MIILNTSTDKIQVLLSGNVATNQLPCYAGFYNVSGASGRTVETTNNTTAVDIVPAPSGGASRIVEQINIHNADTASAVVTVRFNANATLYTLAQYTLGVGERLQYTKAGGWTVFANSGAVKQSLSQGNAPSSSVWNTVVLGSDVVNNNAVANTIQDVTGLSFAVTSGTRYRFRAFIWYTAAATTTGSRWCINGPASTNIIVNSRYSLAATTETINHGVVGFDLPAACNATSAATAGNIALIEGELTPSADGTVIVRFAAEVTASAITAKAGSMLEWIAVI